VTAAPAAPSASACPYCPPGTAAVPMAVLVSFGHLHGDPPRADVVVDLRDHFRDPHAVDGLRELTADDPRVTAAVLATPGIPALIGALRATARAYLAGGRPVTIAIGCAGGRHRSAAVARQAARQLEADGVPVTVIHRDISRPVIDRDGEKRRPS
jgi:RNase adaptor protein for sRNA GlmZ degradation